jgi:hypothetical protein
MTFRILSLDGGGIRGAFTASLLAEIEARLGIRIGDYFDLVAGTSTGAMIAVAVAAGIPASTIAELYENVGPDIFRPRPDYKPQKLRYRVPFAMIRRGLRKRNSVRLDDVLQTKYDPARLKAALTEVFGEDKVGKLGKCICQSLPATGTSLLSTFCSRRPPHRHIFHMHRWGQAARSLMEAFGQTIQA